jgi:hypothetical protein
MLLAPLKTLCSIKFYIENTAKSGWRALFFLVYLFALTSALICTATVFIAKPAAGALVDKFVQYIPDIYIEDGIITVNDNLPLTIQPRELEGYKIYFDTGSTDHVYPTEMEQSKTLITVTSNTVYFNYRGRFQETLVNSEADMVITKNLLAENRALISGLIAYSLAAGAAAAQVLRLFILVIAALIVIALFNAFAQAGMGGDKLLKAACYMQGPAAFIYVLNFISPVKIPFMALVYLIIFGVYGYLVSARYIAGSQPEEAVNTAAEEPALGGTDDTENKA